MSERIKPFSPQADQCARFFLDHQPTHLVVLRFLCLGRVHFAALLATTVLALRIKPLRLITWIRPCGGLVVRNKVSALRAWILTAASVAASLLTSFVNGT